jgi:hypothetical protein
MKKVLIITIVLIVITINAIGQMKFVYNLNPKIDSLVGFFYLNVGDITKGVFFRRDIRDVATRGFYFDQKNTFTTDTLYSLIDGRNEAFINMLDSLKIKYTQYESSFLTYDSLTKIYLNRKDITLKKSKKDNMSVFIKIQMCVYFNHSYTKIENINFKYCFGESGKLISCKRDDNLFIKPITKFRILSPAKFCNKMFYY